MSIIIAIAIIIVITIIIAIIRNTDNKNCTDKTIKYYMFKHNSFGHITDVIVPAKNIEEAKEFAAKYDSYDSEGRNFILVNFNKMLAKLQVSNKKIISKAKIGDRIEEDKTAFILYYPSSGATYEYKTVKNYGKPEEEKPDMHILIKKGKHDTFLYTGSYRCNRHENVSAAFFIV